jgi:hypothetical protein
MQQHAAIRQHTAHNHATSTQSCNKHTAMQRQTAIQEHTTMSAAISTQPWVAQWVAQHTCSSVARSSLGLGATLGLGAS